MINIKIGFLICALFVTSLVSAQTWSLGGAALYGDDIGKMGIHARGYFNSKNGKTCFGPEYSHFIKSTEIINGHEVSKKLNELNFNLHYIIELKHKWGLYPLVGLNMSFEKEETKNNLGEIEVNKHDAFGVNLGAGIHRMEEKWILFAEYDHLFSDLSQNSYLIGAFFTFGKTSEHE